MSRGTIYWSQNDVREDMISLSPFHTHLERFQRSKKPNIRYQLFAPHLAKQEAKHPLSSFFSLLGK
jgi:hypothetical protein